ncbi:MAG: tetrahydrofolate dehydrogenase/cyclohydrolase catalytic domain-containing protein [Bacteroidales bacterium]
MILLDGKATAAVVKEQIRNKVEEMVANGESRPHLVAIIVGQDGASKTYVKNKELACNAVGFKSTVLKFPDTISEETLLEEIDKLNNDDSVDGFIVQLPLPNHIDDSKIVNSISMYKDVDGFNPVNVGKLMLGEDTFVSATPKGIITLLEHYKIPTAGKYCVVLGRSNNVGRPMANLLSQKSSHGDCTVTICHSRTTNIAELTRQADIVIAALGVPNFLTADMIKDGATVIDVGITRVPSSNSKKGYRLVGDVDFDNVAAKCSYISPVPGGVGPMTIVSLMQNTFKARQINKARIAARKK